MDLAKFLSLLQTKSLYFARADKLGDPFEGSITKINHAFRDLIRHHRSEIPREIPHLASYASMTDEEVERMFTVEAQVNRQKLTELYVNCWHMNEHESAAMWRLYTQSNETICIQSTFEKLAASLPSQIHAGVVKYMDYEREFIPAGNLFNSIMTKRMSFAHEQEVRAVAWSHLSAELGGDMIRKNASKDGLLIAIELADIVEAVYVNPISAGWFKDIIENLLKAYALNVEVKQSALSLAPLF